MTTCIALVEGCAECAAEGEYKRSIGHECGPFREGWSTWCEVDRDFRRLSQEWHRSVHSPARCAHCNAVLNDRRGHDYGQWKLCKSGLCNEYFCPRCRYYQFSEGPVDCPTCGSLAPLEKLDRISKMRRQYKSRRRYW